jgi:hypothetical protein
LFDLRLTRVRGGFGFPVAVAGPRCPPDISIRPMYDPKMERIKA